MVIVATGPLTSEALAARVAAFVGQDHLYFYDAVSPVVEAETIDFDHAFSASRYGKGGDDYVNCPLSAEEYATFYQALRAAECGHGQGLRARVLLRGLPAGRGDREPRARTRCASVP